GETVVDIGCGTGAISRLLGQNYRVISLDVRELSLFPGICPLRFDGQRLPIKSQSVDSALFMTVLHHTQNPITLLMEAGRVARQVIVVEDLIRPGWNQRWTGLVDSLLNFEFRNHPHANGSHADWRRIFHALGFRLDARYFHRTVLGIQLGYYCLRSPG
ncbi:MAG: methyltransferase domain-containing protein, partial [FCB group bacterium]|nr:methyltransferase domain-containing protein [FCB group bacterium]